jgi:hypothetical protein
MSLEVRTPMRDATEEFAKSIAEILPEQDGLLIARTATARLARDIRAGTLPDWPETLATIETLPGSVQSFLRERFPRAFEADSESRSL